MSGVLESIYIAPEAGAPVRAIETATLRQGAGIDGDRYGLGAGTFSDAPRDHELTLVEAEVLEQVATANGLNLAPGESRRNLHTRGIELNPLVGKRFRVGGVLCEGTRLCEPCAYLESLLERPGLVKILAGRGGLRALVLEDGEIHVGDTITEVAA